MRKTVNRFFIIIIIILFCCSCSIQFDFSPFYNYEYDSNLKYIEEENKRREEEERKKEIEKQNKINSRNYIDEKFNIYFSFCNDQEKQIYYDILENANIFYNDVINLTYSIDSEKISNIFNSVIYDHPELFWVKSYLYYHDDNDKVDGILLVYFDYDWNEMDQNENREQFVKEENDKIIYDLKVKKRNIDSIINGIVDSTKQYDDILQKEKYVHDYLINKIDYDINTQNDQSIYSALTLNKAVCAGYAKSFQIIMKKLNIPTYYVTGDASDEDGEGGAHAWNLILLGNSYYNVDVTWDDQTDWYGKHRLSYKYFNISDDVINKNHVRKNISLNLPIATGGEYSGIYK